MEVDDISKKIWVRVVANSIVPGPASSGSFKGKEPINKEERVSKLSRKSSKSHADSSDFIQISFVMASQPSPPTIPRQKEGFKKEGLVKGNQWLINQ